MRQLIQLDVLGQICFPPQPQVSEYSIHRSNVRMQAYAHRTHIYALHT